MKKLLIIISLFLSGTFFILNEAHAQGGNCPNLNFGMGTFANWQGYLGSCGSGLVINPSPITGGRHTIMDRQALTLANQLQDEQCNAITKVPTGFNYAARLGNSSIGAEAEAIEYTLTVDSTNSLLVLHFAFIMEVPPGHDLSNQPMFEMVVRDSNGLPISGLPCGHVNFIASHDMTNLVCHSIGGSGLVARNWTTVGYSLESLMGKKIKIYFQTRDCAMSGHFGYAYVVAECRSMTIDLMYCDGMSAANMRAPNGFTRYRWTRSTQPNWVRETEGNNKNQNINVPDPQDDEIFTCQLTSELGPQCSATVKTKIVRTSINAIFQYGVKDASGGVNFPIHNWQSWYDTCTRTATFVDFSSAHNGKKQSIRWRADGLNNFISEDSVYTYTFPDPDTPTRYLIRLEVSTENGCFDSSRSSIAENFITIFPSPRIEIVGDTQMCEGDTVGLKATERRSSFVSYQWSDNLGNNLGTTDSISIFTPGTYYVEALDIAGCIARDTHIVTPLIPVMVTNVTHVNCYGDATGRINHLPVGGGLAPYDPLMWFYVYPNGTVDTVDKYGNQGGKTYSNLKAGTYRFYALDARFCALIGTVEVLQPDSLEIIAESFPTSCGKDNGIIKLKAKGGVPSYKFRVVNIDGAVEITVGSSDSTGGLAVGNYKLEVTDNNGCITTDYIEVKALPIPSLDISYVGMETCEQANGEIRVTSQDAVYPIGYIWSTSPDDTTASNMIGSLKAGTVIVRMIDANGCEARESVLIENHPTPVITASKVPETCGREDGSISLTVTSADPSKIQYIWEGRSETMSGLTGLKAGTYKVTVTDSICSASATIVIDHVDGPTANFEANAYNVASNTIFTLTDVSQGTAATWNWDMGDGNAQAGKIVFYTYDKSGDYIVFLEVLDTNSCVDTISKIIHVYDELNVFIPNMFTPNGDGLNDKWKPVMSEYAKEGYRLTVFDRWGQVIFYTTDTDEAWDGAQNGKVVASNTVYSYRVSVRDFTGQEYEFVGQVTVIR